MGLETIRFKRFQGLLSSTRRILFQLQGLRVRPQSRTVVARHLGLHPVTFKPYKPT